MASVRTGRSATKMLRPTTIGSSATSALPACGKAMTSCPMASFFRRWRCPAANGRCAISVKRKFGRTLTLGRTANLTKPINGRQACHYCGPCERGCIAHAYFNSAFTTLKDALATGKCDLITNARVFKVLMDPRKPRHRYTVRRYAEQRTSRSKCARSDSRRVGARIYAYVAELFNARLFERAG